MRRLLSAVVLASPLLLSACATERAAVPRDQLISTHTTLSNAQASGAATLEPAAEHLRLAQEAYGDATELLAEGENRRAAYVLERAQADAELAWALAQELTVRAEAQTLLQQLQSHVPTPQ